MPRGEHMKTGMYENGKKSRFKKGLIPWNKGKKFGYSPRLSMRGRVSWSKGLRGILKPNSGSFGYGRSSKLEDHPRWKGGISKHEKYAALMSLRRKVRKRGNGGSHTQKQWEEVKWVHHYRCIRCKKSEPFIKLTKDHIIPIVKGGSDNIENIQPLCVSCNSSKQTKIIWYEIIHMRYTDDLGCRYRGIPHDMRIVHENPHAKYEVCQICNRKFRWVKGYKGRVNNVEYLKAHVRNYAQKFGATKRIYYKLYRSDKTIIVL